MMYLLTRAVERRIAALQGTCPEELILEVLGPFGDIFDLMFLLVPCCQIVEPQCAFGPLHQGCSL